MLARAVALTEILGIPPTVRLISEVVGEPPKRVWTILRNPNNQLLLSLLEKKTVQLGLKRSKFPAIKDGKGRIIEEEYIELRWKLASKNKEKGTKIRKIGGPSRIYVHMKIPMILDKIPMLPAEREKLSNYLKESRYIELLKESTLGFIRLGFRFLFLRGNSSLKAVHSIYSPMVKRIVEIADKRKVPISEDLRKNLVFDQLLNIDIDEVKTNFEAYYDQMAKSITEVPDEEWMKKIQPDTRGQIVGEKDKYLLCGICGSKTPLGKSLESIKCKVCGYEYVS